MKMKLSQRAVVLACAILVLLCACNNSAPEPVPQPDPTLVFDDSVFIHEDLPAYVRTMTPEDTVKVNILLDTGKTYSLGVKLLIEEEYGIPVLVCNAIAARDYEKSDPYAREWYNSKIFEGEPTFDENIDNARISYIKEYERMTEEMGERYKRELFADLPIENTAKIDYSSRLVMGYSATAKELSRLSQSELVSYISPWTEDPVEPPESVTPAYTYTDNHGSLEISVILDREAYAYGDTVNLQVSVCNKGEDNAYFAPIIETGNNRVGDPAHKSGFYYITADFLADGTPRRDLSCVYGYDWATCDVKPTGVLESGEIMSKTYAYTPHKSYKFLGEGAGADSRWSIKVTVGVLEDGEAKPYSFEVEVPRADK